MTPEMLKPAPRKHAMILQRPRIRSLPLEASFPARSSVASFEMEFPAKAKQIPKILRLRERLLRMHLVETNPAAVDAPSSSNSHRVKQSWSHPTLCRSDPGVWSRSNLTLLHGSGKSLSRGRNRSLGSSLEQHNGANTGFRGWNSMFAPPSSSALDRVESSIDFSVSA